MKPATRNDRRQFLKSTTAAAAGLTVHSLFPGGTRAASRGLRFAVVGLNHGHITAQTQAVLRGGGELISFYAPEADLITGYAKQFPQAKLARGEKEILEDPSIQLVVSASIPSERAPLGLRVMQSGKDFMSDKPGITSLEQLAEVRRVQRQTKRVYSIMYSERFENAATVKAGELVKAGAIGKVIQTIGLGPHSNQGASAVNAAGGVGGTEFSMDGVPNAGGSRRVGAWATTSGSSTGSSITPATPPAISSPAITSCARPTT